MKVSKSVKGKATSIKSAVDSSYTNAQYHIKCAMEAMNEKAKTDIIAKTAITDLAVVLFDLSNPGK